MRNLKHREDILTRRDLLYWESFRGHGRGRGRAGGQGGRGGSKLTTATTASQLIISTALPQAFTPAPPQQIELIESFRDFSFFASQAYRPDGETRA